MNSWLNFNGSFIKETQPIATANNRGLRYGEGLFETMRWVNGSVSLGKFHFERLLSGMAKLKLHFSGSDLPDRDSENFLISEIGRTIERNNIRGVARVRLMVFRGDGELSDIGGEGNYVVQAWPLQQGSARFNEEGLRLGVFKEGLKSCDELANLKTNNYLLYTLAAIHAKENNWNDCVVLNHHQRVCESTIANIFWVKEGNIFTPALSEGCVAGVMRRYLIENIAVTQSACYLNEILQANEIFLTNAVRGVQWVKECDGHSFSNKISRQIYEQCCNTS